MDRAKLCSTMSKMVVALRGTWQYLTLRVNGRAVPKGALVDSRIEIARNQFRVTSPEERYQGTFTIDDAVTPHAIDIAFDEGPAQGTCLGIFELDKDSLTICLGASGGSRPKRFASAVGSGHALETLRRVTQEVAASTGKPGSAATKPGSAAGKAGSAAGKAGSAAGKAGGAAGKAGGAAGKAGKATSTAHSSGNSDAAELAAIGGTWTMVSGQRDGQPLPSSYTSSGRRIAKGDETTVLINGAVFLSARMSVNPSLQPKTIDYVLTSGANRGKRQLGIYALEGDRLTLCFAKPGQARPDKLTAAAGSGRTLSVWERSRDA